MLPQPVPALEAFDMIDGLMSGFPDLKWDVHQVTVNGNQATVHARLSGTNTGELHLPMPGIPMIPVTGKKVSIEDVYIVTVQGDKVSHFHVDSPPGGGIPGMLAQLGVKLPGM
jgi:predicted ester cyclase